MTNFEIKKLAANLKRGLIEAVGGDVEKAFSFACEALVAQEVEKVEVSPLKRKRGRPEEFWYSNEQKLGLPLPKRYIRERKKLVPNKIGAPQKYSYGGLSTKTIANIVWYAHQKQPEMNWRELTRNVLKARGFYVVEKQVKQIAELASRVDPD